jgi:hypothetical protein
MPPINSVLAARFGLWVVIQLVSCGCGLMFLGPSAESDQFGKEIMPLSTASSCMAGAEHVINYYTNFLRRINLNDPIFSAFGNDTATPFSLCLNSASSTSSVQGSPAVVNHIVSAVHRDSHSAAGSTTRINPPGKLYAKRKCGLPAASLSQILLSAPLH